MRSLRFHIPVFFAVLLLSGCIVVSDFGEYWGKGFVDNCVNEIAQTSEYDRPRHGRAKPLLMRSLRLGNHTFLMIREDNREQGGNLQRYKIENGQYVAYRLNESKREDFLRQFPNNPVILTSETATIPLLNAETAELLSKVADDESYWVESRRETYNPGKRTDCIQTLY